MTFSSSPVLHRRFADFDMGLSSVYTALCGISIVVALIPLAWHTRNRNVPAICLIIWLTVFNLCALVSALIWSKDDITNAWDGRGFCDVQVKILIGGGAGQIGSTAAIARSLARIMSDNISVVQTKARRRRELIEDLLLCLGTPVWMMLMHYVVQPNRYVLLTTTGCTPTIDRSWPSIVLILIWPPIISLISAYYASLVLFRLHKYRARFSDIICNSHSNITKSRFIRLFILSVILILAFLPTNFYILFLNLNVPRLPYSWKLVHSLEWDTIVKVNTGGVIQFDRWIPISTGILLFLFFGLGHDAIVMYRGWAEAMGLGKYLPDRAMGRRNPSASNTGSSITSSRFSVAKSWASKKISAFGCTSKATTATDGMGLDTVDVEKGFCPSTDSDCHHTSNHSPNPFGEHETTEFVSKAYSEGRDKRIRCSDDGIYVQRDVEVVFEIPKVRKGSSAGSR